MKNLIRALLILLLAVSYGCMPPPERKVVFSPKPGYRAQPLVSPDLLEARIDFLNEVLQAEGVSDQDRETASHLLEVCILIKKASSNRTSEAEYRKIIQSLFHSISLFYERYFAETQDGVLTYSRPINLFTAKKKAILNDYLAANFKGVIDKCLELKRTFGQNAMTPEIALLLALSLAKEGMLEEAINIGERIARELEIGPDLIYLRTKIVEWQLALNKRTTAFHTYEKLTDDLDEREALVKELAGKLVGKTTPTVVLEDIGKEPTPLKKSDEQDLDPMDRLLREVDELVQKQAYDEAKLLLIKHRLWTEEGPAIETIDQALRSVELAQEEFKKKTASKDSDEKDTIEMAKKLIEEENFEEAISRLEELKAIHEVNSESEALMGQAIEKLINSERNRAAKFFLAAQNTKDSTKKKEYLRSSHKILKAIDQKYPSSNLNNKIKDHMKKVKEEMEKLGISPEE